MGHEGGDGRRGIFVDGRNYTGVDGHDGDQVCSFERCSVIVNECFHPNLRIRAIGALVVGG